MKDKRRKYIIVDAKDINVTIRGHERVSGFNDFWNEYPVIGQTNAKKVFEEHQIPEQFQRIAFALPTCRCCNANGKEVLTGRQFQVFKNSDKKELFGDECARWSFGDIIGGCVSFRTPKQKKKYTDVVSFYEQLTEQGYLEQYIAAIKSMFFREYELQVNNETTKIEDKAASILKSYFVKQLKKH